MRDSLLTFGTNLSVVNTAGSFVLGSLVDLGKTRNRFGDSRRPVFLVIAVTEQITIAGEPGTISFQLRSDAQDPLDTSTSTLHLSTIELVTNDEASINAGVDAGTNGYVQNQTPSSATAARLVKYKPVCVLQLQPGNYERYLGLVCTIGTSDTVTGAINAWLTDTPPMINAQADAL